MEILREVFNQRLKLQASQQGRGHQWLEGVALALPVFLAKSVFPKQIFKVIPMIIVSKESYSCWMFSFIRLKPNSMPLTILPKCLA